MLGKAKENSLLAKPHAESAPTFWEATNDSIFLEEIQITWVRNCTEINRYLWKFRIIFENVQTKILIPQSKVKLNNFIVTISLSAPVTGEERA